MTDNGRCWGFVTTPGSALAGCGDCVKAERYIPGVPISASSELDILDGWTGAALSADANVFVRMGADCESRESVAEGGGVTIGVVGSGGDKGSLVIADGIPSVTTDCWAKHNDEDDTASMPVTRAQRPRDRTIGFVFAVMDRRFSVKGLWIAGGANGLIGACRVGDIGRPIESTVPIHTGQTCIAIVTPE